MIAKIAILLALIAAPALSSSVKGYADAKGLGRVEQQAAKEESKQLAVEEQQAIERLEVVDLTSGQQREESFPRTEEARAASQQARYEPKQPATREEPVQRVEAAKAPVAQVRYDARPQVQREEQVQRVEAVKAPASTQTSHEQRPQIAREDFKPTEQQRAIQEPTEADEQRRLVDQPALVQPIAPLTVVEETHRDQFQHEQRLEFAATKGAAPALVQAPLVEAEPYAFSYQVDGSSRSESGDSRGVVRGQYTIQGADGASRIVDYIADANGFRATVNTNEFGTEARSPANVVVRSSQPLAEDISLRLEGKTREDLQAPQAPSKTAPVPAKPDNWAFKAPALALPAPAPVHAQTAVLVEEVRGPKRALEFAAKGQKFERLEQPLVQALHSAQQQEAREELKDQIQANANAPDQLASSAKSAELRAPKELKTLPAQHRDYARASSIGFESATAHRVLKPQPVYAPAPAVALRQQAKLQTRKPVALTRAHLQRDRYPPRRAHEQASNPRVSFYAPNPASFDDDLPAEQSDA